MSDVEMVDNESMDDQLANDGQPLENSLGGAEIKHQQEKIVPASIQDDQNPGEMKFADDESKESEAVDEIPEQNGNKDQILCNDEKQEQSVHVTDEVDNDQDEKQEQSVHVPDEIDNDQDEKLAQSAHLPDELDNDQDVKLAQSAHLPDELDNDQDDSEKTEVAEYGNERVAAVHENEQDPATPTSIMVCSNAKADDERKGTPNSWLESEIMEDDEDGSLEEQAAFMKELECFYRERAMEFKPPKFYQQPLNCLKLWRAVIKLGGYDLVTTNKLWRQVGISFHPPKTCTTVSFTFRIFYEKALLEYEKYKTQNGELQLSAVVLPESSSVDNDANGYHGPGISSRLRRDAASRAMQGWHVQKLFSNGEVGEPASKDKNYNIMPKEKSLKSIGSMKHKRPAEMEHTMKAVRTEIGRQMAITVEDAGPPADWVKINVREAQDCFEVYALVPGLLREEVRVQSDPAGRLVITGQPEQPDNPWGITAFRKVVTLPARIDPLQTSAVVSLHGRLYIRVPFEESDI